jgi:ribonuclease P protein component
MLKKRNRLSRREFAHLLKYGWRVHGEGVTIVCEKLVACSLQLVGKNERPSYQATQLSCPQTDPPAGGQAIKLTRRLTSYQAIKLSSSPTLRVGVVVGKKVAKNAVDRNKRRRAIYGILGEVLSPTQTLHIAILTRPKARTMTQEEMREEIQALLVRCG